LISWIYRLLLNRKNIGPDLGDQICGIDGCAEPASDQWFPSTCALREAGVQVDWFPVCVEHDAQINEKTVRFFFGEKYDKELAKYRTSRVDIAN
jgi:hypothetical protein